MALTAQSTFATGDFPPPFICHCIPDCCKFPSFHEPVPNPEMDKKINDLVDAIRRLESTKELTNTERMKWIESNPNRLYLRDMLWFTGHSHIGYNTAADAIDNAIRSERENKSAG